MLVVLTLLHGCGGTAALNGSGDRPDSVTAPAPPLTPEPPAAASAPAPATPGDPLEGFNRAMYSFNDTLDVYVMKPVAKGYRAVLPDGVRRSVSNFFANLREPIVILNDLLQGKFGQAFADTGRFLANTTLGVVGLFDVATPIGLERHNEDFGQTLGAWGVGEGAYLVLPFFGPSNIRDGAGLVVDWETYPPNHMRNDDARWALWAVDVIDTRSRLLDASDVLEQAGGRDPYAFLREAYRQRRRNLVYDGNPPAEPGDKSLLFEDDEPAAPAKPKPPAPADETAPAQSR